MILNVNARGKKLIESSLLFQLLASACRATVNYYFIGNNVTILTPNVHAIILFLMPINKSIKNENPTQRTY
jgi:hypothetical protein